MAGPGRAVYLMPPVSLIFPVTAALHTNPHYLDWGVLLGTPHFKGAYLLLEI